MDYFGWAEPADGPSNSLVRSLSAELGATILSPIFEAQRRQRRVPQLDVARSARVSACTLTASRTCRSPTASPRSSTSAARRPAVDVRHRRARPSARSSATSATSPSSAASPPAQGADVMCVPVACASEPTKEVFQLELRGSRGVQQHVRRARLPARPRGDEAVLRAERVLMARTARCWQPGRRRRRASSSPRSTRRSVEQRRRALPFFRDRRPDLYGALLAGDGG